MGPKAQRPRALDFRAVQEKGEIPMDMPGYMPLGLDSPEQNMRSFQLWIFFFGGFWEEGSEYL